MTTNRKSGAPYDEPDEDASICAGESPALLRVDRLGRVKEWTATRRLIEEDPLGRVFTKRVAVIISKTYAECGDAAAIADDVALMLIRDMLLDLDKEIIKRNRRKRLARSR